jgi:hypothetical protein
MDGKVNEGGGRTQAGSDNRYEAVVTSQVIAERAVSKRVLDVVSKWIVR